MVRSRYAKRCLDDALGAAFRVLSDTGGVGDFAELVYFARCRSEILGGHQGLDGVEPQVLALRNLAVYSPCFKRGALAWPGQGGSMYRVVASLAQHLFASVPVPMFLASVWYGGLSAEECRKRGWYIDYAAGKRFRDLDLPIVMTRRMEHFFLLSPDHLSVECALRRAEILALGGTLELAGAVCATRLGWDLSQGGFWRTVVRFLVSVQERICLAEVGPIIDFVHAMRFELIEVEGGLAIEPPQPEFSMKGRSLASVLRLVDAWHAAFGRTVGAKIRWGRSKLEGMRFSVESGEGEVVLFEISELTDSGQLQAEGRALQHCVLSYAGACSGGRSSIWSLRKVMVGGVCSLATIEVDSAGRWIVQVRGLRNRLVAGRSMEWIRRWAKREGLGM